MHSAGRRTRSQQSSPGERRTLISLGTLSGIASFASVDRRVEEEHGTCEGRGRWDDPKRMSGSSHVRVSGSCSKDAPLRTERAFKAY